MAIRQNKKSINLFSALVCNVDLCHCSGKIGTIYMTCNISNFALHHIEDSQNVIQK
jgi:hypothetical protein